MPDVERKGRRTRAAILAAAARRFRHQGFERTTLQEIAADLGLTRSAILHHFGSKADVLVELVTPFLAAVDELLDTVEADGPLPSPARRRVFTALVDVVAAHRDAAVVTVRDITAHANLGPDLQIADRAGRLVGIVAGNHDEPLASAVVLAALGTIVRPMTAPDTVVDLDDPATRALLVDCAVAVLEVPLPVRAS